MLWHLLVLRVLQYVPVQVALLGHFLDETHDPFSRQHILSVQQDARGLLGDLPHALNNQLVGDQLLELLVELLLHSAVLHVPLTCWVLRQLQLLEVCRHLVRFDCNGVFVAGFLVALQLDLYCFELIICNS